MSAAPPAGNSRLRVAIVGAGAIGGTVGAYLARAGHDVTLVDADGEHLAAIRERGLRIVGPLDAFTVRAPAYAAHDVPGRFETVFLCVKAHATEVAVRDLVRFLADDGVVNHGGRGAFVLGELDGMVAFNRRSAKTHSGVWRDLAVRKRRTEGEAQLGPIVREAAALGLDAPLVARILAMVREVEEDRRGRARANLDELEALRAALAAAAVAA